MKKSTFFLLLAFFIAPTLLVNGQTTWDKYVNNPILEPGPEVWDLIHVLDPFVINDDSYKMWYTGQTNLYNQIGYATSSNGLNWTKNNSNPVLVAGSATAWDDAGVSNPSVLFDNGIYKMWYTGVTNSIYQIGYATSSDGIAWIKYATNPVLVPDVSNPWEMTSVRDPHVIKTNGQYIMYFSARGATGPNNIYQIGRAVSSDGINWIKEQTNPILTPGTYPSWDAVYVMDPSVHFNGQNYQMWYVGTTGNISKIGYATSADGVTWTKYNQNPVVSPDLNNPWEEVLVSSPNVLIANNEYLMYFSGKGSGMYNKYQIGKAVSTLTNINNNTFNKRVDILIYPNPASNQISINTSDPVDDVIISIIDMQGRVLTREKKTLDSHSVINVNIEIIPAGIYNILLVINNQVYHRKIIVS